VNTGGVPKPKAERGEQYDITGNVRLEGEDPSPDDRERGETSNKDRKSPVDLGSER
jgi:hypothetical protein